MKERGERQRGPAKFTARVAAEPAFALRVQRRPSRTRRARAAGKGRPYDDIADVLANSAWSMDLRSVPAALCSWRHDRSRDDQSRKSDHGNDAVR